MNVGPNSRRSWSGSTTARWLRTVLRRHARVWLATALTGLALGLATASVNAERAASTEVLLSHRADEDPAGAMATDAGLAESRTVAGRVVDRLRLDETADGLLARYTATPLSDRVLQITAVAPTDREAVRIADTVAGEYLLVRTEQTQGRVEAVRRDVREEQGHVDRLWTSAVPDITPTGVAEADPKQAIVQARERVSQLKSRLREEEAAAVPVEQSRVLDPAVPDPSMKLFRFGRDGVAGLVVGLLLGVGFVVARAVVSSRPWEVAEVADLLGAPLALGVRRLRPSRWWHHLWPLVPRSARAGSVEAAVGLLSDELGATPESTSTLAIVAVDCVPAAALLVASAARSYATDGRHVLVADLTRQAVLARRLGAPARGTSSLPLGAGAGGVTVHVPDRAVPAGLLHHRGETGHSCSDEGLIVAWSFADVVLTLTELRPAQSIDHLDTWSTRAVAVVSAGGSSPATVDEVGYRLRVAGLRLGSAVVLGADRETRVAYPAEPARSRGSAPDSAAARGSLSTSP